MLALTAEQSPICFSNDIDGLAGEEELAKLVECLYKASTAYGMEISAKKTKLMTNKTSINKEIKVNGQKLETVTSFKYLGSVVFDEGSKPEILSRIAHRTAALTRLRPVWNDRSIILSSKIKLMCSLVTSIFSCMPVNDGPSQPMEMRCYRKILCISYKDHVTEPISYKDHVTNEKVCANIQQEDKEDRKRGGKIT